jgi:hypothetical protein
MPLAATPISWRLRHFPRFMTSRAQPDTQKAVAAMIRRHFGQLRQSLLGLSNTQEHGHPESFVLTQEPERSILKEQQHRT